MKAMTIDEVFARAVQLHQSGRFAEAEGMYRQSWRKGPATPMRFTCWA